MTDEELTDAWESGVVFAGGITHEQHVRIARVLHLRHGAKASIRLLVGTQRACATHGCPEKFDVELTRRWSQAVGSAVAVDAGTDGDEFLAIHPLLRRSDLFRSETP